MFGLGIPEIILIIVVLFLLFGARRLPEIAKGLGKSINLFKQGLKETDKDNKDNAENGTKKEDNSSKDT